MRFQSAAVTDVGSVRSENQDAVLATSGIAVVADGMGGHRGGEVAASLAVGVLDEGGTAPTIEALLDLARRANREVFERSLLEPQLAGMGTTLCAVAPLPSEPPTVGLINVGDSRIYLLDDDGLRQLSEDHSFVETLVREGRLTPAQAEVHPQRNVLTRALGIEIDVLVDAWIVDCREGDRFLLCSDGLFNEVTDVAIEAVLREQSDPEQAARQLVELAVANGGHDNVSCVIADLSELPPTSGDPRVERRVMRVSGGSAAPTSNNAPAEPVSESALEEHRPGFTWRVGVLVLSLVAILAVAAVSVGYVGQHGEWLKVQDGLVVRFEGRPDGVLWVHPTRTRTGIRLEQIVNEDDQKDLCEGFELEDGEALAAYLERLQAAISASEDDPTSEPGAADCDELNARLSGPAVSTTTNTTTVTTASSVGISATPSPGEVDTVTTPTPPGA